MNGQRFHVEFDVDGIAARFVNWVQCFMDQTGDVRQSTMIPRLVEFDRTVFDFLANQPVTRAFRVDAYGVPTNPVAGRLTVDSIDEYNVLTVGAR